jgi:SAM-dependent methyltransferase
METDNKGLQQQFSRALWRLYNRPERPEPWSGRGNLPWDDPAFSERMLREHLDESHGAASRVTAERRLIVDWLEGQLHLSANSRVLDVTCGPGLYAVELARRGCQVTGIDFGPAAIAYARELAGAEGVAERCRFVEADVRAVDFADLQPFDAALFLYGQLGVFKRDETQALLEGIAGALRAGGKLVVELLNKAHYDKGLRLSWWFTDYRGLWGDRPFLCLGERQWYEKEALSFERFYVLHLESGQMDEIDLCDQAYEVEEMRPMMLTAGFATVTAYEDWAGLPLYDAREWVVYVAEK